MQHIGFEMEISHCNMVEVGRHHRCTGMVRSNILYTRDQHMGVTRLATGLSQYRLRTAQLCNVDDVGCMRRVGIDIDS